MNRYALLPDSRKSMKVGEDPASVPESRRRSEGGRGMRLFVAMNFPASLRRSIAAIGTDLARSGVPARWVDPADVHLTLKFLGDLPPAKLEAIVEVVQEIATGSEPVTLRFEGVGAFPSPRRPRVIWLGIEAGPRLRLLADALDRRMAGFGVSRETRPFRPHVTLGRVHQGSGPGEFREFERRAPSLRLDQEIEIDRIALMESRLRPDGPEYREVHAARLGLT